MSSVGKRRRERIRAKRAADSQDQPRHVTEAPGRQAKVRRRRGRKRLSRPHLPSIKLRQPDVAPPSRTSLRQRRTARQREKQHREQADRPQARVLPRGMIWVSWRWLSGSISLMLLVILYFLLNAGVFEVNTIAVGGWRYLTPERVFEASGIAGENLFMLDASVIEERLESNPSISTAEVYIDWPPNMVSVFIAERDPALTWEQDGVRVWVDVNGIVMYQRETRDDLILVVHQGDDQETLGVGSTIDREIVAGVQQLKALQDQGKLPRIKVLLYHPVKGLGFLGEGNWKAWFGVGTNMDQKLLVYDAIVRTFYPTIQFAEVDVSDPDHPTFVNRFPDE